jgi:hypothetical protein
MSDEHSIPDEEWEQRQLCSDGNCIGVIGPDGRCKECGKPAEGGPPPKPQDQDETTAAPPPETDSKEDAPAEAAEAGGTVPAAEATTEEADDDDWANRRLCPDGNCIGVIGPDGKCKECGRPAE